MDMPMDMPMEVCSWRKNKRAKMEKWWHSIQRKISGTGNTFKINMNIKHRKHPPQVEGLALIRSQLAGLLSKRATYTLRRLAISVW